MPENYDPDLCYRLLANHREEIILRTGTSSGACWFREPWV